MNYATYNGIKEFSFTKDSHKILIILYMIWQLMAFLYTGQIAITLVAVFGDQTRQATVQ
jgi:hypothetical protein